MNPANRTALRNLCWTALPVGIVLLASTLSGCIETKRPLKYIGDERLRYYKDTATNIEYPQVHHETEDDVLFGVEPQRIRHLREMDIRDMTLVEAVHLALTNNKVFRTNAEFLSPANRLLTSPNAVNNSVFDPAIQETEVFNGIGVAGSRRGVEDALSDFDARFTTNMTWQKNERVTNSLFDTQGLLPGSTFKQDNRILASRLEKQLANGGIFALVHNINFTANNGPPSTRLFPSFYDGLIQAEYRQPLLAGAGTAYTRIAGPVGRQQGNINGVNRGVLIARIGQDISLADFEIQVRNLVRDVEDLYWDLSLAYRTWHSEVIARDSSKKTWLNIEARWNLTGVAEAEVSQAAASYWDARARSDDALAELYSVEGRLRRLLGLPVNDGKVIRPVDEPVNAEFLPDWNLSLAESLTRRVELRKQKWEIKSLELQHKAAKSLLKPRLDFVIDYRVNGFGRQLFGENDSDGLTTQGFRSAYETITQGNQTGWNMGFEFSMPLGFRQPRTQVRNIEQRLMKARAALAAQEHEISHELANAFRDLDRYYVSSQNFYRRRQYEESRVAALELNVDRKPELVDQLLRSHASLAQADVSYYRSLLQYNKTIADIHFRKGTSLERNNVFLSEGVWDGEAYQDAFRRAMARSHAFDQERLYTKPGEFVLGYMNDAPKREEHKQHKQHEQHEQPGLPDMPQLPPEVPKPLEDPINPKPLKMAPNTDRESLPRLGRSSKTPPVSFKIQRVSGYQGPDEGVRNSFQFEPEQTRHIDEFESLPVEKKWFDKEFEPSEIAPEHLPLPQKWNQSRHSVRRVEQLGNWSPSRGRVVSDSSDGIESPEFKESEQFEADINQTDRVKIARPVPHFESESRSEDQNRRRLPVTPQRLELFNHPNKAQVKSEQLKYWRPSGRKSWSSSRVNSRKPVEEKPLGTRKKTSWTPFDLKAWKPSGEISGKLPERNNRGWTQTKLWKPVEKQ